MGVRLALAPNVEYNRSSGLISTNFNLKTNKK